MSRVLLSTALLLALAGCDFLLPGDDSFIPGEIVLSVKQEVTIDFVESYAAARGLEVLDQFFPEVYLMWAAVTDGDVERHLEYLQASPLVQDAHRRPGNEIQINVFVHVSEEDALELIRERPGIDLLRFSYFQKFVTISVRPGTEDRWVRHFRNRWWVVHASRNQEAVPLDG